MRLDDGEHGVIMRLAIILVHLFVPCVPPDDIHFGSCVRWKANVTILVFSQ